MIKAGEYKSPIIRPQKSVESLKKYYEKMEERGTKDSQELIEAERRAYENSRPFRSLMA